MKKSIAYLPKRKQEDLNYLVREINKKLPQAEMVILYGSYARDEYVEYDERDEFGIRTSFMSDYDILVATYGISDRDAGRILDSIDDKYYQNPEKQTPVQFINEDIEKLNSDLSEGRYFYTQIKHEGVMLYDSGRFKLARRRKLRYDEIKRQAEEYFEEKYKKANYSLRLAQVAYDDKEYVTSSFLLHQACENLIYATRLTFTLKNNKQHNLIKLLNSVKKYSNEFMTVIPRDTPENNRLFDLLKRAYVEARYNPDFTATKEDIDALMPHVKRLFELVNRICHERIDQYGELMNKPEKQ